MAMNLTSYLFGPLGIIFLLDDFIYCIIQRELFDKIGCSLLGEYLVNIYFDPTGKDRNLKSQKIKKDYFSPSVYCLSTDFGYIGEFYTRKT